MELRELYEIVDFDASRSRYTIQTLSSFPDNPYTRHGDTKLEIFEKNGCAFTWLDFINRVDTAFQHVGHRKVVSISNNVIIIE